jgi:hypothetical protein
MCITKEDYRERLLGHKHSVFVGIQRIIDILHKRGLYHDDDKFDKDIFKALLESNEQFSSAKYGTKEYYDVLEKIRPSLEKHYKRNPHHPQHYENGIKGMNLIDLCEMLVDWKSASSAYGDGFMKSLEINKERFQIDDDIFQILLNTANFLGYIEEEHEQ